MLSRPNHAVLVKNKILSEILNQVQDNVSRTFDTEEDLLPLFTGSQRAHPAFDGWGGFRYAELHPKPYGELSFMVRCGADEGRETSGCLCCWQKLCGPGRDGI